MRAVSWLMHRLRETAAARTSNGTSSAEKKMVKFELSWNLPVRNHAIGPNAMLNEWNTLL